MERNLANSAEHGTIPGRIRNWMLYAAIVTRLALPAYADDVRPENSDVPFDRRGSKVATSASSVRNVAQIVRDHSIAVTSEGSVTINYYTVEDHETTLHSTQTILKQEIQSFAGEKKSYAEFRLALVNAEIEQPVMSHHQSKSILSTIGSFFVSVARANNPGQATSAVWDLQHGKVDEAESLLDAAAEDQRLPPQTRAQAAFYRGLIAEFIRFQITMQRDYIWPRLKWMGYRRI